MPNPGIRRAHEALMKPTYDSTHASGLGASLMSHRSRAMSRDLPNIAPLVPHHSTTIPVSQIYRLFERLGSRFHGASIRLIGVVDVHVQESRYRVARIGVTDHENGILALHHNL
jgi:hypothetical protein